MTVRLSESASPTTRRRPTTLSNVSVRTAGAPSPCTRNWAPTVTRPVCGKPLTRCGPRARGGRKAGHPRQQRGQRQLRQARRARRGGLRQGVRGEREGALLHHEARAASAARRGPNHQHFQPRSHSRVPGDDRLRRGQGSSGRIHPRPGQGPRTRGITVNSVAPGVILTRNNVSLSDNEQAAAQVVARVALGRLGQPEDVAVLPPSSPPTTGDGSPARSSTPRGAPPSEPPARIARPSVRSGIRRHWRGFGHVADKICAMYERHGENAQFGSVRHRDLANVLVMGQQDSVRGQARHPGPAPRGRTSAPQRHRHAPHHLRDTVDPTGTTTTPSRPPGRPIARLRHLRRSSTGRRLHQLHSRPDSPRHLESVSSRLLDDGSAGR
ncbi:hypothetical protein RKD25_009086 [Streptomyces sp. SAI-124]